MTNFDFYLIAMTNKKVYLEALNGKFVWTRKKEDAIHFDTHTQAQTFATNYFTYFKNYEIVDNTVTV